MRLFAFAPLLAAVYASPLDHELVERRPKTTAKTTKTTSTQTTAFCSAVNKIVTSGGFQSTATKFCSSYLSIPAKTTTTVTSTTTSTSTATVSSIVTTVTVPGVPTTTTTTTIVTNTATETETETETTTGTVTSIATAAPRCTAPKLPSKVKRAAPVAKPACFSTYSAGPILSSACSCLSIPGGTATATATASTSTIVTVTKPTTATTTSTATITETATITTATTVTETSTTTTETDITVTSTTTVGPTPTPTLFYGFDVPKYKYLTVSGSGNAKVGAFNGAGPGDTFSLDSSSHLIRQSGDPGAIAATDSSGRVYILQPSQFANSGVTFITCSIDTTTAVGCLLSCTAGSKSGDTIENSGSVGGVWDIGTTRTTNSAIQVYVVDAGS